MPLSNLDHQKIYYYVICVMAFFVLMWGAIDFTSSSLGLISLKLSSANYTVPAEGVEFAPLEKGDQMFDSFYQQRMFQDRFWDSFARLLVAGVIFGYCRTKVKKLEVQV